MKNKSFIVCIVLSSFLNNGIAFAFGEGFFMKEIKLNKGYVTQVDDADYEWLNQWHWWTQKARGTVYVIRKEWHNGKRRDVRMHRQILGLTDPKVFGDHIDGNGLNNQRANIRKCTCAQNNMNATALKRGTSSYKGVSYRAINSKWVARIGVAGKIVYVGDYLTQTDAALAYNEAAIKYHGEFARLNIINQ